MPIILEVSFTKIDIREIRNHWATFKIRFQKYWYLWAKISTKNDTELQLSPFYMIKKNNKEVFTAINKFKDTFMVLLATEKNIFTE